MIHCYPLLKLLSDCAYHSGEELASALGISRTAVWKQMRKLESAGLTIFAVRGKGYRLVRNLELLDQEKIRSSLSRQTSDLCPVIEVHPELDSTNRYLMKMANQGYPSGAVCLAERQTHGRGRHGRTWVSPFAANIYLSLLWRFPCSPLELGGLSLAIGVAVAKSLKLIGLEGIGLKWPNDLIWNGRKLGGILLEVSGETGGPCVVVIGVGINVNMPEDAASRIEQPWIDIAQASGKQDVSRNSLIAILLEELVSALTAYPEARGKKLLDEWRKWDVVTGKSVSLSLPDRQYSGTVLGIDDSGMLILDDEGTIKKFSSGEVSLRVSS